MSDLPKIVRRRLAAGPQAGNAHPDADLLAALAEQRLDGAERERVLAHLAACAECREVAAIAAPREEPTQIVVRPVRRRWWLFQPAVVRWGSAAAVLALVAVGVSLYRSEQKKTGTQRMTAYVEPAPAAARPAAPAAAEAEAKPKEVAKAAAPPRPAAKREAQPSSRADLDRAQVASNQVQRDAAAGAPASRVVVGGGATQEMAKAAPAASTGTVMAENAVPPIPTAPMRPEATQNAPAAENSVGAKKAAPAQAATVSAEAAVAATAPAANAGLARRYAQKKDAAAQTRWGVASDGSGSLELSRDGGRSWSKVAVAKDVKFQAVSASGADVWAGGSGGALFHSSDGGQSWTRVPVGTDEDIVRVDFRDARHGAVTTASGAQWTTGDGGKSWKSQK